MPYTSPQFCGACLFGVPGLNADDQGRPKLTHAGLATNVVALWRTMSKGPELSETYALRSNKDLILCLEPFPADIVFSVPLSSAGYTHLLSHRAESLM